MIAAVILLLAVPFSASFLGVADLAYSPEPVPSMAVTFSYDEGSQTLTVVHESGRLLGDDSVRVRTADGQHLATWQGPISAGDSLQVQNVAPDAIVEIVWYSDNRDTDIVLVEWNGPDSTA